MHPPIRVFLALVWLANGLWAKVLGGAPRHREIVAVLLGRDLAEVFTVLIGIGEVVIALWILSGRFPVTCGWVQIILVVSMNLIEQAVVPGLLLWGRWNLLWAFAFALFVWWSLVRKEDR